MHHTLECVIGSARWVGGYLVIFKLSELNISQAKTVGGGMTPNRKMSRCRGFMERSIQFSELKVPTETVMYAKGE